MLIICGTFRIKQHICFAFTCSFCFLLRDSCRVACVTIEIICGTFRIKQHICFAFTCCFCFLLRDSCRVACVTIESYAPDANISSWWFLSQESVFGDQSVSSKLLSSCVKFFKLEVSSNSLCLSLQSSKPGEAFVSCQKRFRRIVF